MMILEPLVNPRAASFQGNPPLLPVFAPDSKEGFSYLFYDLIANFSKEDGHCDGFSGLFPPLLSLTQSEELPLSPKAEKKPLIQTSFDMLTEEPLLSVWAIATLLETQGPPSSPSLSPETPLLISKPNLFSNVIVAQKQEEIALFSEDPEEERLPFVPQPSSLLEKPEGQATPLTPSDRFSFLKGTKMSTDPEETFVPSLPHPSRAQETAIGLSVQERREPDAREGMFEFVRRTGPENKEPSFLFETSGTDRNDALVRHPSSDGVHRVLNPFAQNDVSGNKGGMEPTSKFEFVVRTAESGPTSHFEDGHNPLMSDKHPASDLRSSANYVGISPESKTESFGSREVLKTESVFTLRTEPVDLYHQVARKIVWSIQHGEEKIRLKLAPSLLGNLSMEVSKEKDVVRATLWAESPLTKELLETHRIELRKALEEDGFKLETFDVFVQQESNPSPEKRGLFFSRGAGRGADMKDDHLFSSDPSETASLEGYRISGKSRYIDRIL